MLETFVLIVVIAAAFFVKNPNGSNFKSPGIAVAFKYFKDEDVINRFNHN
jgi:hypothetical protein